METPEKFEDIIRSKFSQREVPFDEANWENIKKMSDAAREKKKRRRWGFIFLIGLVCGCGITIPFVWNAMNAKKIANKKETIDVNENKYSSQLKNIDNEKEKKSNPTVSLENTGVEASSETKLKESKLPKDQTKKVIESVSEVDKNNTTMSVKKTDTKEENKSLVIADKKGKKITSDKVISENASVIKKPIGVKNVLASKVDSSIVAKHQKATSIAEVKKAKAKPLNKKKETDIVTANKKEAEKPVLMAGLGVVENKTVENNNTTTFNVNKKNEEAVVTPYNNNTIKSNTTEVANTTTTSTTPPTVVNSPKGTDSTIANKVIVAAVKDSSARDTLQKPRAVDSLAKNTIKPDVLPTINSFALSLVAGGNFATFNSFSPIAGFELTKSMNEHWKVGGGLFYTYYLAPPDNTITRTNTATNYDFGSASTSTKITVNKLHYTMLNIFTEFNLNKKNALVFGTNLFYLFTVDNTITTFGANNYTGVEAPSVSKKTHGYSTGLSPYDVGIMAGYRRKLFGRLDAGLYANWGLLTITDKNFVQSNSANYFSKSVHNTSFQLVLKYNLLKK